MGTSGLEPPTSRLSGVRSNHLSYAPKTLRVSVKNCLTSLRSVCDFVAPTISVALSYGEVLLASLSNLASLRFPSTVVKRLRSSYPFGGDEEDRTPDPLRARQVLSQLSYTPV